MGTPSLTVLVVDDEPSIRLLCRVNLELDGHRVLEADSLAGARERLAAHPVQVVLLDVRVGAEDGLAFLDELRREQPGLAVALLTGSAVEGRRLAGADAVIPKPFPIELLSETVHTLAARYISAP